MLELRVANLGTWGPWVPPGWRVDGALQTSASIGGRFGAPEYTGQVIGSQLAVRNFLQGVNVSDGDVAIHLQGARARIERFTAKAGSGSIKLEGDAELGEAPRAQLKLQRRQVPAARPRRPAHRRQRPGADAADREDARARRQVRRRRRA